MRNNPLLFGLVLILFLFSLGSVALAARYFFAVAESERLQAQYVVIRSTLNSAQRLANESILYSRVNPAITSVLLQFSTPVPMATTNFSELGLPEGPAPMRTP